MVAIPSRRVGVSVVAVALSAGACSDCTCGRPEAQPDERLPSETRPTRALSTMSSWKEIPHLGMGHYREQSSAARRREGMADDDASDHDYNHFICRGRLADAPDASWVSVDEPVCKEPDVRGMVMARFEGSGALARFWLTSSTMREGIPEHETVRFYADDMSTPVLSVPLAEFVRDEGNEMLAPPFGAGHCHEVAWHYPVVFGNKLVVTLDGLPRRRRLLSPDGGRPRRVDGVSPSSSRALT